MLNFENVKVEEFRCGGFPVKVNGYREYGDHVKKADAAWKAVTAGGALAGEKGPWHHPWKTVGCPTCARAFLGGVFYYKAADKDVALNSLRKVAGFSKKEIDYVLSIQELFAPEPQAPPKQPKIEVKNKHCGGWTVVIDGKTIFGWASEKLAKVMDAVGAKTTVEPMSDTNADKILASLYVYLQVTENGMDTDTAFKNLERLGYSQAQRKEIGTAVLKVAMMMAIMDVIGAPPEEFGVGL